MRIEEAIKQKSFKNEYQKAHVNVLYTAAWLTASMNAVLKPFGLSMQQFNILRILRGKSPEPATIRELTEKMIDKMSNASRLVEKLRSKGLVDRRPCPQDRRRVEVRITPEGEALLARASEVVEQDIMRQMSQCLREEEAILLNELLDQLRCTE